MKMSLKRKMNLNLGCWQTPKYLTHAQPMKMVTVGAMKQLNFVWQECQSKQDVPIEFEGQRARALEGQFANKASILEGTNFEEVQKWKPPKG